ncbi:hypothetical protein ACSBR1_018669 [Camellia fascicularis]
MDSNEVPIPDPTVGISVALGADMEAEEAKLLSLAERPFDAATYQPRTHVPPPGGILRFEGFILGLDEDTLLREPIQHVSADTSMMRVESWLYGALVERWWDTTDSFHFSLTGEITLTPYDFSMLTVLRVRVGGPVPFDPDMTQLRDAQLQLLGEIPDTTSHEMVRYSWFLEYFSGTQPAIANEVVQYTCGFLIYLIGTTLLANRENTMGLYILGTLVHLSWVVEYDRDGTGLATLYCYMSSVSRRKADSLGSYWRVWEVYPTPNFLICFTFCSLLHLLFI